MELRHKYLKTFNFLKKPAQMVFISGPRQSGKTTFAKEQLGSYSSGCYLNWDIAEHRKKIFQGLDFNDELNRKDSSPALVILDEIHKYSEWKNYLKGLYDSHKGDLKFLVTGSGRLDFFQKGKDSLAGRYFLFHLWPLTMAEFVHDGPSLEDFLKSPLQLGKAASPELYDTWDQLGRCSGFPDPFFSGSEKLYRVWSDTYRNQLIREDVRQLTRLEKIDLLERLVLLLPHRVGGTLSIDNLAQDLQVAFDTVKKWLLVMERFYICFRISPWTKKVSRAITKEQKLYLFDYAVIKDLAAKFENMIALDLLRAVRSWREQGEGQWDLYFIRDRNKCEVDFLLVKDQAPILLIEAKLGDTSPSASLVKFQQKLNIPAVQLVATRGVRRHLRYGQNEVLICNAADWLAQLP